MAGLLFPRTGRWLHPIALHLGQRPLAHTGIAVIRGQRILASGFRKMGAVCTSARYAMLPSQKQIKAWTRYSMEAKHSV